MCGIVGFGASSAEPNRGWLRQGRDAMTHRGPDDAGEWWSADGRVGLAHRRLSIVDLSPLGHQPMHLPKRGLSIVFNGEIYNYHLLRDELIKLGFTFLSNSDTEVILAAYAAWGEKCVARFIGMFAFAIYDEPQQKLFLARDRAGEKPLFYYAKNRSLQFASELKAILVNPVNPRRIDVESLDCYLAMGYVPGKYCILDGYNKLPPAHALSFDLLKGETKVWQYWQLPEFDNESKYLDEATLVDELEFLLENAVRDQMVADVPVGVLLSGGVDSSLITAMAVRTSNRVQTFTIGFPGYGKLDETEHARLISRHFGTDHTELMAENATVELLPRLAQQFDEPMVDSSMIPTFLVSHLVRQKCTVALGGDGGDELFGGYGHYSRLLRMQQIYTYFPRWFRKSIAYSAERFLPVGIKGRNYLQNVDVDLRNGLPLIANYFDITQRHKLLREYLGSHNAVAESIRAACIPQERDLLQRSTRMDFKCYLVEDILVKIDRASMLNSLEIRAPFLDHRLIEFAFKKVPSFMKANKTDKKILLKKLTERVLPKGFDKNRKQGFSIPLTDWLTQGPFRELFWDTLLSSDCIFDSRTIQSLLKGQDNGFSNGERLFALVQFELWRKNYKISF
jgi:asparagine synthase (glutamine-hydrolysing)